MTSNLGQLCERARQWTSLRADGELSQLESALLDSHLASCGACRSFAVDVVAATSALRAAPAAALSAPIFVSRPGRAHGRAGMQLAGAAAVIAAMMAGAALGIHSLTGGTGSPKVTAMISTSDSMNTFRNLRRAQLIAQAHPVPRNKAFS
jgi:predicted anti-sigma-YlaC factor YlaD